MPGAEIEPTKWDLYATELFQNYGADNVDHDDRDDCDDHDDHDDHDDDGDDDDDEMVRNAPRKAKKLQMGKCHSTPKEAFYTAAREMLFARSKNFA